LQQGEQAESEGPGRAGHRDRQIPLAVGYQARLPDGLTGSRLGRFQA
jgi:hypothetical protein